MGFLRFRSIFVLFIFSLLLSTLLQVTVGDFNPENVVALKKDAFAVGLLLPYMIYFIVYAAARDASAEAKAEASLEARIDALRKTKEAED